MRNKQKKFFNFSKIDEKVRYKLYKSGKHWVKAALKDLELLRIMGPSFMSKSLDTKSVENREEQEPQRSHTLLKASTLIGGIAAANVFNDQQAFAASDTPVTSELSSFSETIANQNSTLLSNSTDTVTSVSETPADSEASTTTEDSSSVSQSVEKSESVSMSESIEASESISTSNSVEKSASVSLSESVTTDATSTEDNSTTTSLSETSNSDNSEQYTSTVVDKSESTKLSESTLGTTSTSSSTSASDSGIFLKSESNALLSDSISISESPSLSTTASASTVASETVKTSSARLRSIMMDFSTIQNLTAVTSGATTTYTGSGIDVNNGNIPIYYKLVVTNLGTTEQFTYSISYDNPNTSVVEKPSITQTIANSPETGGTMVTLGSGYGAISNVQTFFTDSNGNKLASPATANMTVYNQGSGKYTWSKRLMSSTHTTAGMSMVTQWTAPINSTTGNLSYTFTPYATQDNTGTGRTNFYSDTINGTDTVQSQSVSTSVANSQSTSQAQSTSVANSQSVATSNSVSASAATSTSVANSTSTSIANSQSTSTSVANSQNTSTSTSTSTYNVNSQSTSTSISNSISTSVANSTSKANSVSTSTSTSVVNSTS